MSSSPANLSAAVIIPVWNGRDYLARCLDALLAQDYAPLEIIAVDNASTDGSADLIRSRYPSVTLLAQAENLGFGGACNVGLGHGAGADVRVLLNQDTEVKPGWLAGLVEAFTRDPQVGLAGSKAYYPDGAIQHAGALLDPHVGGRHIGVGQTDDGQVDAAVPFDYLSGVALAISAPAYAAVGGLDEGFEVAYFEDVDWCYRVRAAGFRLAYVPESTLIHYEESRLRSERFELIYLYQRNRLRLLLKHWPMARLQGEFLPAEQAWLGNQLSATFVSAVQQAYGYHLLHVDEMVAWRREFLGDAGGDAAELAELLLALRLTYTTAPAFPPADGRPGDAARVAAPSRFDEYLTRFADQAAGYPTPPASPVPVLGPLIDWLRKILQRVGGGGEVHAALQQQQNLNWILLDTLRELEQEQRRTADMLVEYARTNARETAALAAEVRRLHAAAPGGDRSGNDFQAGQ